MTSDLAVPDELAALSWLIGSWQGVGVGGYPSIESFNFGQEVTFTNDGRPFLGYRSRSWLLDDAGEMVRPLAVETGFWRMNGEEVELMLAHPTGIVEIWLGAVTVTGIEESTITGARVELATDVVARTVSAKEYQSGHRLYGLVDGDLLWAYDMAAVGEPLTSHVSAQLRPA